eukprot:m.200652 g.200652  ORF g.200652 m.200652 type:complete len:1050 (+) comp32771_c2_seq6:483-3632(+)
MIGCSWLTKCVTLVFVVGTLHTSATPIIGLKQHSESDLQKHQAYRFDVPEVDLHRQRRADPPTVSPTMSPTIAPTMAPTTSPTTSPTLTPTLSPTGAPTMSPTTTPTTSPASPTTSPTVSPTASPTVSPTTSPTTSPTLAPTIAPTLSPTGAPTMSPTMTPTTSPTSPTTSPTVSPTASPSVPPTSTSPSNSPTLSPSSSPSVSPTSSTPTVSPSASPTQSPTSAQTLPPTTSPSLSPSSSSPTAPPTTSPTSATPTTSPVVPPTTSPTESPTESPLGLNETRSPSFSNPSSSPTTSPTLLPTSPTSSPTTSPSTLPTTSPSISPTSSTPTISPSASPSTISPTESPLAGNETRAPSQAPTFPLGTTPIPVTMDGGTAPPTTSPTTSPTPSPTTSPTKSPSKGFVICFNCDTRAPTVSTTPAPTQSTASPVTQAPTTPQPTSPPSALPSTTGPTTNPVFSPTSSPTLSPNIVAADASQSDTGEDAIGTSFGVIAILLIVASACYIYYRHTQGYPLFSSSKRNSATPLIGGEAHEMVQIQRTATSDDEVRIPPMPELKMVEMAVMNVESLKQKMASGNQWEELMAEYNMLEQGMEFSRIASQIPPNQLRNRYRNILPYDYNRVKLALIPGLHYSEYINASYVGGFSGDKAKYIAAQGPKDNTIYDFWRMIVENNTHVVVMVTNCEENGRPKCEQYWPKKVGDQMRLYNEISITWTKVEEYDSFVIREMKLAWNEDVRTISQYHYTAWPDHGVPETTAGLRQFVTKIRQAERPEHGPSVIHCSAGVGRTGTLIGIDYNMDMVKAIQKIDVLGCLNELRRQRPLMVQTEDQYIFIYRALNDLIQSQEGQELTAAAVKMPPPPTTLEPRSVRVGDDEDGAAVIYKDPTSRQPSLRINASLGLGSSTDDVSKDDDTARVEETSFASNGETKNLSANAETVSTIPTISETNFDDTTSHYDEPDISHVTSNPTSGMDNSTEKESQNPFPNNDSDSDDDGDDDDDDTEGREREKLLDDNPYMEIVHQSPTQMEPHDLGDGHDTIPDANNEVEEELYM